MKSLSEAHLESFRLCFRVGNCIHPIRLLLLCGAVFGFTLRSKLMKLQPFEPTVSRRHPSIFRCIPINRINLRPQSTRYGVHVYWLSTVPSCSSLPFRFLRWNRTIVSLPQIERFCRSPCQRKHPCTRSRLTRDQDLQGH